MNKAQGQIIVRFSASARETPLILSSIKRFCLLYDSSLYYKVTSRISWNYDPNRMDIVALFQVEAENTGKEYNIGVDQTLLVVNLGRYYSLCSIYANSYTSFCGGTDKKDISVNPLDNLVKPSICECGKDKHGFAEHTSWCPKHV